MVSRDNIVQRVQDLLEVCDLRLGSGQDSISITGTQGLTRLLEDVLDYLSAASGGEDSEALEDVLEALDENNPDAVDALNGLVTGVMELYKPRVMIARVDGGPIYASNEVPPGPLPANAVVVHFGDTFPSEALGRVNTIRQFDP